jgi:hypothetical protein
MRVTGRSPCSGPRCPVVRLVDLPLGRLATRDRQGDLDRQAAWTIQRLTGDGPARAGPGRFGDQDLVHPSHGLLAKRPRQPPPARFRHGTRALGPAAQHRSRGTGGPQARGGRVPRRNGGPPWR